MNRIIVPLAAAFFLLAEAGLVRGIEEGRQKPPQDVQLKPGEYVWDKAAADQEKVGAIDIVVSLGEQLLSVYRDGLLVGRSTISSGSKGRETPKGIYMILEKNVTHHSNKYHEASMPFMERLTWGGLAIHAGNTPGHPESHGCMHVPENFAKDLYGYTQEGNTVLVADGSNRAEATTAPNALFAADAPAPDAPAPEASPAPVASPAAAPASVIDLKKVPNGPILIVFSSVDKRIYVYRKGVDIGHADLSGPAVGHPFGDAVYVALADGSAEKTSSWNLLGKGDGSATPDLAQLAKDLTMPPGFREELRGLVKPGTTLVLTDRTANNATPTGPGAED